MKLIDYAHIGFITLVLISLSYIFYRLRNLMNYIRDIHNIENEFHMKVDNDITKLSQRIK